MRAHLWLVLSTLFLLPACATTPKAPKVDDAWVARLPPERMGEVNAAREAVLRAKDEVTRAEVAVGDAKKERSVQKSLHESEDAKVEALQKSLEAAKSTGDPNQVRDARERLARGQDLLSLAKERVEVATFREDAAKAEKELAEQRHRIAELELERAEYHALRGVDDVRVRELSDADFDRAVNELSEKLSRLEQELSDRQRTLAFSERRLKEREDELGVGGAQQP